MRAVVEVVLVSAGRREEELDAVAADAVVAGEQGRAADGASRAAAIVAGPHANPDLHDVPRVTPHHRDMRVVIEVVFVYYVDVMDIDDYIQ